jgi:hypothetical protein
MYEIPQQLEYKEKIVFGLTFEQLIPAMIFLPIIIIIFRMNLPITIKVFLIFIPISLAAGFMFFNLTTIIKRWVIWFKFREIKQDQVKNWIGLTETKDNLFYLR